MPNFNNLNITPKYRTNYFESFSDYVNCVNDINLNYLNILCLNIRSINAHFDELILYLENDIKCKQIDILVLTETWHNTISCHYKMAGYNLFFSSTKRNQNDGIIIFVKNHINTEFFDFNFTENNIVKLSLNINNIPITIICVYRSPSVDNITLVNSLKEVLVSLNSDSGLIALIGDMNINIIGASTYNNNNDYLDFLSVNGLNSFINVYTRMPKGQQHSCLDHVFIKSNNLNMYNKINAGVLLTEITDHCATILSIPILVKTDSSKNKINIINHETIKSFLIKENWTNLYSSNSVNECCSIFQSIISNAINNATTTKNVNSKNKILKDWMTKGLLCSARHKQYLSLKCKKHPNNEKLEAYYKKYKNNFTKIVRLAKVNFYEKKFHSVSHNVKSTWKLINEVTGSFQNNSHNVKNIKLNNDIINIENDPVGGANVFNNYFVNVGKLLAEKLAEGTFIDPIIYVKPDNLSFDSSFLKHIDEFEVKLIINKYRDKTAAGHDRVSVKILKCISDIIVKPLVHIFNLSIQSGIFPDIFKLAIVKPLFKGGDQKNMTNYRPISMLTNFAKIFEKIIKSRLVKYLENNNLLSKNQYGFRSGLGTENALYEVTQFIYENLDNGKKVFAVFLDLAKAFDTIHHDILSKILPIFGITNSSLNWFNSYISNRKQIVKLNDFLSDEKILNYGVPQGSVLGPILFILYINEICNLKIDGKIVTYADDTCLLFSDNSWEEVNHKAIKELNLTHSSLKKIGLFLNYDKTMYMKFSINKTISPNFTLIIHNCNQYKRCDQQTCKEIKEIAKIRYLGIIFDNNLRWDLHTSNLVCKLRSIIYKFVQLNNVLPSTTIRNTYFAFYQSIIQYGLLIWGGVKDNNLKNLQQNQNCIVRIILNKKSLDGSTNLNYKMLGALPLRFLYKKIAILYVIKKFITSKIHKLNLIDVREHRVYDLPIKYTKKSFGQSFVDYLGPKHFNELPISIKKDIHTGTFNRRKIIYSWLFSVF